ncbi:hypothetical protein BSKO_02844 [Bryopsis sp. KO-2023]|nr:hypothetical protein BSKO_02844 [Bryopsis sp. KO-2023]
MNSLQESLKKDRAMVSSLREQLEADGEQLEERDDLIVSLRATLEENVSHRAAKQHEIESLQGEFAALEREKESRVSLLEEKIKEQDQVISQKEEMIKATERKKKEMIQKKDDEIQALEGVVENTERAVQHFKDRGVPLFLGAVRHSDLETVEALMSMGFDVNTQDNNKQTVLSWAAEKGHHSIVKTLLLKGLPKLQKKTPICFCFFFRNRKYILWPSHFKTLVKIQVYIFNYSFKVSFENISMSILPDCVYKNIFFFSYG